MAISQKCQYALRAIFELALQQDKGPCKIGAIADAQGIPSRFLENILNSLKSGGFVSSARGKDGGYYLEREANSITVGEVIRFVQGPLGPVECSMGKDDEFSDDCVFRPLWEKARRALEDVYDGTTIQDLVDNAGKNCRSAQCAMCGKKIKFQNPARGDM